MGENRVLSKETFPRDDFDELTEVIQRIFDNISLCYDGTYIHLMPMNINDIDRLLLMVKKHRESIGNAYVASSRRKS